MKYCTKNRNENWFEAQHVADLAKKKKKQSCWGKKIDLLLTIALLYANI